MCYLTDEELTKLRDEKIEKERRQNNKQHATKIDQGLRSVDSQTGPIRAIWELCQNARDLAEDCHIKMELTAKSFRFSHNGIPFDMDSLSSLIKQVSGQFKENDDTVGQYGTGFLTTHYYGMRFSLYGSYHIGKGRYIDLDGFVIDRAHENIDELIVKITKQLGDTDNLLERAVRYEREEWTTFDYELPSNHIDGAVNGIEAVIKQMPYVMLFNDRITECQIDDNISDVHISFRKSEQPTENGLKVMRIDMTRNEEYSPRNIYYLESESGDERVVLPLENPTRTCSLDGISKLFMHFPLLGTEDFGFNFVFHSRNFKPKEKRDGLYFPDGNENNAKESKQNMEILDRMKKMVFEWLKEHISEVEDTKALAVLCFNSDKYANAYEADFIRKLEGEWGTFYAKLPMVPTTKGMMSVLESELYLLDAEIVECLKSEENVRYLHSVCYYAQLGDNYVLPIEDECIEWSNIVYGWRLKENPFIDVSKVAHNVQGCSGELHDFLLFLKACGRDTLFTSFALIPNREGALRKANELRNAQSITRDLYVIARPLIKACADKFVDELYTDIYAFEEYDRSHLRKDIKQAIDEQRGKISNISRGNVIDTCLSEETIRSIIDFCSAFSTKNGNSVRNRILPVICKYKGVTFQESYIPKVSVEEPDIYENAFCFLMEYIMFEISCKDALWVEGNQSLLSEFLNEVSSVDTYKKEASLYCVFPNQNYDLCLAKDLRKNVIDQDKCEDLLRIYKEVLGKNLRKELVHHEFESYWDFEEMKTKEICEEIEKRLADDEYSGPIPIEIIEKIDNDEDGWGGLFKSIRDNKQNIFFKNAVSGRKKNDVYRLMKADEDTLAALANLAEQGNMTEILDKAQKLIEQERLEKANFELMYSIGKHIEDMIREIIVAELGDKLQVRRQEEGGALAVDDIQNGQDIIVSLSGQDIYYIEVKSKRNFLSPAYMSKNQIRMACKNADKYALCCVDLSCANCTDIDNPTMEEILPHIHFKNDIGKLLAPLLTPVLDAEEDNEDRKIKLDGDYSASIPKRIFGEGLSMDEMIKLIVNKIETSAQENEFAS